MEQVVIHEERQDRIWTVVHKETGYTLRSHNRQKVEKKMARFHTAHVKLTWR